MFSLQLKIAKRPVDQFLCCRTAGCTAAPLHPYTFPQPAGKHTSALQVPAHSGWISAKLCSDLVPQHCTHNALRKCLTKINGKRGHTLCDIGCTPEEVYFNKILLLSLHTKILINQETITEPHLIFIVCSHAMVLYKEWSKFTLLEVTYFLSWECCAIMFFCFCFF